VDSPVIPNHREIAYRDKGSLSIVSDQITGGELAGLLRARDQVLSEGRNSLGLVAVGLSFEVNAQHREGLNLMDQTGLDFFSDLTLSQSRASTLNGAGGDYLFDIRVTDPGKLPAADLALEYLGGAANDLTSYQIKDLRDDSLFSVTAPPPGFPWDLSADLGLEIDLASGATITAGDIFFFSPTAEAAGRIGLEIRDPEAVAAASPIEVTPVNGEVSLPSIVNVSAVPVSLSNPVTLTYTGPDFDVDLDGDSVTDTTLAYDPATQSGGQTYQLDMGGYQLQFTIGGYPAPGDVFTFDNGTQARPSDNRNARLIADLQSWQGMQNGTANIQDSFGNYVAAVGSRTRQAQTNLQAQERMYELNKESLQGVVGVNLDEEAANLIRYGQAYQAAAQTIATANSLFDSLLSAVR
jgi:flagellar hook-associated protein 1 FlgK